MERNIFLEHYRINHADDGSRVEIGRNGPAITYKATHLQSGAPVALTLLPISSVDAAERERFEEKARSATLLDHINIAKTVAFGLADDYFVFVSEYPQGDTVEAWITAHGPMPADAVLRVALQVVAALGVSAFHGLTHPAIQPSNLFIVPGKRVEGGWPMVKLMHFGLAGLKVAPGQPAEDWVISDFASPEQLLRGTVDFRSEIYSLGATMCFLLTGVFYSAQPRWPQTKHFARPLRNLIASTLLDDPAERPQDPVLFAQKLRECLTKIERRQAFHRKLGIPFTSVPAKPARKVVAPELLEKLAVVAPPEIVSDTVYAPRRWISRRSLAIAAMLLGVGIVAALMLPEDVVRTAFHRNKPIKTIGVPIGVPDASPAAVASKNQNVGTVTSPQAIAAPPSSRAVAAIPAAPDQSSPDASPVITQVAPASNEPTQSMATSVASANQHPTEQPSPASEADNSSSPGPAPVTAKRNSVAANAHADVSSPSEGPQNSSSAQSAPPPEQSGPSNSNHDSGIVSSEAAGEAAPEARAQSPSTVSKSRSKTTTANKKKLSRSYDSNQAGTTYSDSERSERPPRTVHRGTFRARVIGRTPGGNLILRLPNGQIAYVRPPSHDGYYSPPRRAIIPRAEPVAPQPPLEPFRLFPDDD